MQLRPKLHQTFGQKQQLVSVSMNQAEQLDGLIILTLRRRAATGPAETTCNRRTGACARGERGHGATLRARGSVSSGTPPEQDVTLVLLPREREREQVSGGTTLIHSTG